MAKKKGIFEKIEAEVIQEAEVLIKKKLKRKMIQIGELSIYTISALLMFLFGLARLLAYYLPILDNGLNYLILAVIFLMLGVHVEKQLFG